MTNIERTCLACSSTFVVDTSQRCWWSKKFCDEDCRTRHQNKIRCEKALVSKSHREWFSGVNKCEWCDEPFVVDFEHRGQRFCSKPKTCAYDIQKVARTELTAEQREANEILRRQRSADGRRGQQRTPEQRNRIAEGTSKAWADGKYAEVDFSALMSEERREKISQGMIRAYREGRVEATGSYQNKWHTYDGPRGTINMRSKSETIFAHHLDSLDVDWQYEPKRFDLGWSTYTPDFYMPEFDRWVEVKGQWTDISLRKFTEFRQTHQASAVLAKDLLRFAERVNFEWDRPVRPVPEGGGPSGS